MSNSSNTKAKLENSLAYSFQDPSLLSLALSHRSFGADNYERLEFIGDAILGFVIADDLYRRFPSAREGQLTRVRASLVNGSTLADMCRELQLGASIKLGLGEKKNGGDDRDSILADVFEAVIGAIYLDGGIEAARGFILTRFATKLSRLKLEDKVKDSKSLLQEWLQSHHIELPVYTIESCSGPDHQQVFEVSCVVESKGIKHQASGSSRKIAEQLAADMVYKVLIGGDA